MKKTILPNFRPLLLLLCLSAFLLGVYRLEQGRSEQGQQQLEEAVRRAAVACYAQEGFYPPDVDYLCRHYGLTYEPSAYIVYYEIFASNLMPDITVLEREP